MANKRPLYKRERTPARVKGTIGEQPPISCLDASPFEVTCAIASLAWIGGIEVGRCTGYDSLTDKYHVIGKNRKTKKAQDATVDGSAVGTLILVTRLKAGEKMDQASIKRFIAKAG